MSDHRISVVRILPSASIHKYPPAAANGASIVWRSQVSTCCGAAPSARREDLSAERTQSDGSAGCCREFAFPLDSLKTVRFAASLRWPVTDSGTLRAGDSSLVSKVARWERHDGRSRASDSLPRLVSAAERLDTSNNLIFRLAALRTGHPGVRGRAAISRHSHDIHHRLDLRDRIRWSLDSSVGQRCRVGTRRQHTSPLRGCLLRESQAGWAEAVRIVGPRSGGVTGVIVNIVLEQRSVIDPTHALAETKHATQIVQISASQ